MAAIKKNLTAKQLLPKRRFPDFDSPINTIPLAKAATFVDERIAVDELTLATYVSTENMQPDFGGIETATSLPTVRTVTAFQADDILVANIRPYLRKVWQATFVGGASNDAIVIRAKRPIRADFLACYLRNDVFINYVMNGAKGVKMPRGDLDSIRKFPVFKLNPSEQQKIASCLMSLDKRITIEACQLSLFKNHKRGLLQQLFPRKVDNTLIFPVDLPMTRWKQATLGAVSKIVRGGSPRPIGAYLTRVGNGHRWLKIGDLEEDAKYVLHTEEWIKTEGLSKTREINPGDLILSNSMSFGRPYISKINACIHDGWLAITDIASTLGEEFLYYFLGSHACQVYFQDSAAGSGVRNLNIDILEALPIWYPSTTSQQQIVNVLSSIDELISAQGRKIELLERHKKGLMQQLFPTLNEVGA